MGKSFLYDLGKSEIWHLPSPRKPILLAKLLTLIVLPFAIFPLPAESLIQRSDHSDTFCLREISKTRQRDEPKNVLLSLWTGRLDSNAQDRQLRRRPDKKTSEAIFFTLAATGRDLANIWIIMRICWHFEML